MTTPVSSIPDSPPPPPRAVDSRVGRRAWGEPHVRFWWLSAIVFACIAGAFVYSSTLQWERQRRLIKDGVPIQAEIVRAGGITLRSKKIAPQELVELQYEANGQKCDVMGYLDGRTEFIIVGDRVPIRVDPQDPTIWTYRTEPLSLATMMIAAWVVAPIPFILVLVAFFRRGQLLKLWRGGMAQRAIVVSTKQSVLAPASQLVKCMRQESMDRRVLRVYVPISNGLRLQRGDEFWLITPSESSTRAIAAARFEG